MTDVPGFTTTSRPSIVAVTNPGFLGGGGAGGPGGGGFGAAAGAAGLFSSAIAVSLRVLASRGTRAGLLLDLAGDVVDAVVDGDQVGEEAADDHRGERGERPPRRRTDPQLVRA